MARLSGAIAEQESRAIVAELPRGARTPGITDVAA
jgi:hypothetical protein